MKEPPGPADGLRFETLAIHAGQRPDPTTGAVMTPVYLTSTYAQESPGKHRGFEYSRTRNPTRDALEGCLAALEGAAHGLAFASGLAATDCFLHTLESGAHVPMLPLLHVPVQSGHSPFSVHGRPSLSPPTHSRNFGLRRAKRSTV